MKTTRCIIVSLVCSFVVVGCSQKSVTVPPPSSSSRIIEQTLESPAAPAQESATGKDSPASASVMPVDQGVLLPGLPEDTDPLSLGFVNGRIIEYEQNLALWQELDNQSTVVDINAEQTETMLRCYRDLQSILSGYRRMRDEKIQTGSTAANGPSGEKMETLRLDISFLAGTCGGLLGGTTDTLPGWQQGQGPLQVQQAGSLIDQAAAIGDYEEVIALWEKIPADKIGQAALQTRLSYAHALMVTNQAERAAQVYQQIVDEMSSAEKEQLDLLVLRKRLADLYIANADYTAAEVQYSRILADYLGMGQVEQWSKQQLLLLQRNISNNPELNAYSRLLRSFLGYLPERDGFKNVLQAETFLQQYPYSPVSENVDIIKEDVENRAIQWFTSYLAKIDTYQVEKNYQEALILTRAISREMVSEEDFLRIKEKEEELVLAEAVALESQKRDTLQELQRNWNEGIRLAEEGDIDGALVLFRALLDTEYGTRAELKISELSLEAATTERRRAADYFVRFTRAPDSETKKEMLIESRRILKDILKKYPTVNIADKVAANIRRVEKEMKEIDPLLLPALEEQERQEALLEEQEKLLVPEEEVDVFDLPLTTAPAPGTIKSSEPLPVIVPADLQ